MSTTHHTPHTKHNKTLSVVLATLNEEANIERCLQSVKDFSNEIIIFDEESIDNTKAIAEKFGAKVFTVKHEPVFHITKQKAIDAANGDWILQIDADEVVTPELEKEILKVINSSNDELMDRYISHPELVSGSRFKLFKKHQILIEARDGKIGKPTGEVVAFFIPRINIFMGKPLIHGGVYPDPAIRLIKKGKAHLPAKDVHEIMVVDGEVGWLVNPLEHYDSPTFERYLKRNNRYTDLIAEDYKKQKLSINVFNFLVYILYKPVIEFISLFFRHRAFLDGFRGFIWSFFSALRFPISYFKYKTLK